MPRGGLPAYFTVLTGESVIYFVPTAVIVNFAALNNHTHDKMQERQRNRQQYFDELATTSERWFVPYITRFKPLSPGMRVLEIGCGDGGNLLPLARMGLDVTGVDISVNRIGDARRFFAEAGARGTFVASDIFKMTDIEHSFDVVLCHDVFEHITDKRGFVTNLGRYVREDGVVFMSFPAWQMPFGGHQQICRSRLVSHWPFLHLLPGALYRAVLKSCGEPQARIDEMMDIKSTRVTVEMFERLARGCGAGIVNRELWFINPHYEIKFGLRPRHLWRWIGAIPWVRNFFTTSCFYIIRYDGSKE